jgi:hypothetical protein
LGGTFVRQHRVWTQIDTIGSPSARRQYAMAYDEARGEIVLYGGEAGCEECANDETWILSGDTWEQRTQADGPPPTRYGR